MSKLTRNTNVAKTLNSAIAGNTTTADFMAEAMPLVNDVVAKFQLKAVDAEDLQQNLCMYLLERVQKKQGISEKSLGFLQMQMETQAKRMLGSDVNECSLGQANGVYADLDMDEVTFQSELHDTLYAAMDSRLTEREKLVLEMRFGLNGYEEMTLREVGNEFNRSSDRIRQIEAKALRKLRHPSSGRKLAEMAAV